MSDPSDPFALTTAPHEPSLCDDKQLNPLGFRRLAHCYCCVDAAERGMRSSEEEH
ncbi:MAG: hypothetical protein AAF827_10870 [Cyanobacteria bacterium P01_D01_bin.6]